MQGFGSTVGVIRGFREPLNEQLRYQGKLGVGVDRGIQLFRRRELFRKGRLGRRAERAMRVWGFPPGLVHYYLRGSLLQL